MKQRHKVWRIRIGSYGDEQLRDRQYWDNGQRSVAVYKLPVLREFLIEDNSIARAQKKALKQAEGEGITRPVILFAGWDNNPYGIIMGQP